MLQPAVRSLSILALVFLMLASATSFAQPLPRSQPRSNGSRITDLLMSYERVEVDAADALRRVRRGQPLALTTPTRTFDVRLVEHDIRSANCVVEATGENRVVARIDPGPISTFRGTIDGMPGAEARFTIDDEGIEGLILTDDESWFIEPELSGARKAGPRPYILYAASAVIPMPDVRCGATQAHDVALAADRIAERPSEIEIARRGEAPPIPPVVDLATEADWDFVSALGGGARRSANEIASIVNQVDGIYQRQLGVAVRIVYQHAWTTPDDPYRVEGAPARLFEFKDYWNRFRQDVDRDLAHMWTGTSLVDNFIGFAEIAVLCSSRDRSYGVSLLVQPTIKVTLTAHEMGHNFSAVHPNQVDPPHTECARTIMNSIIVTETNFCAFSRGQIEQWLAIHSNCLVANHVPTARAGPDRFAGRGAGVSLVGAGTVDLDGDSLQFDWLQTAGPAATLASATTADTSFIVPPVDSESALSFTLTVEDIRGAVTTDTVTVTVLPGDLATIAVTSPTGASEVKAGKKLQIRWTADPTITGTVRIELSRDGGATFETLFDDAPVASGVRKWKVSGPSTTAALLRITSNGDQRVQGFTTSVFSIR